MALVDYSIDPREVAHFDAAAGNWWDTSTAAGWLHKYNHVRVPYVRDALCRRHGRDPGEPDCLRNLSILDIGCGGGVLCEPLARLGANVTGVDPSAGAIRVAERHARETGVTVDYRCNTIEGLARDGEQFDAVLAMEVIEHVADIDVFLRNCAELVRPGGLMILSTINRTVKSYVYAIAIGEYLLRLLPLGAHQWKRFVKPDEIDASLVKRLFKVVNVSGVTMNLSTKNLQLSKDASVNYILTASNEAAAPAFEANREDATRR